MSATQVYERSADGGFAGLSAYERVVTVEPVLQSADEMSVADFVPGFESREKPLPASRLGKHGEEF